MNSPATVRLVEGAERTRLRALVTPEEKRAFESLCRRNHLTLEQGVGAVMRRAVSQGKLSR